MAFNPLEEQGVPVAQQVKSWQELNGTPISKAESDAYTKCRIVVMNGAEMEAMLFSHQFARHTADPDIRRYLAQGRRAESQQQKWVNWLLPSNATILENTITYEQVAVDLTAWLARKEPDPQLKEAYNFGLLEDFDHLYRYANLLDLLESKKAAKLVDELTEIMPGRPTELEHRHPHDEGIAPMDSRTANPLSVLHMMTIVAAEQQTLNYYMNVGNLPENPLARALYIEIAQIEEQHVTHYESALDPTTSWWQREVLHQYNECYLYYSFMQTETDPRIKAIWEENLAWELGQLQEAIRMYQRYEQDDPTAFLPPEIPEPVTFEPNKAYIRDVLARQLNVTGDNQGYAVIEVMPKDHRYFQYQQQVNAGGAPSQQVIDEHVREFGTDYRLETEGPHPIPEFRQEQVQRQGEMATATQTQAQPLPDGRHAKHYSADPTNAGHVIAPDGRQTDYDISAVQVVGASSHPSMAAKTVPGNATVEEDGPELVATAAVLTVGMVPPMGPEQSHQLTDEDGELLGETRTGPEERMDIDRLDGGVAGGTVTLNESTIPPFGTGMASDSPQYGVETGDNEELFTHTSQPTSGAGEHFNDTSPAMPPTLAQEEGLTEDPALMPSPLEPMAFPSQAEGDDTPDDDNGMQSNMTPRRGAVEAGWVDDGTVATPVTLNEPSQAEGDDWPAAPSSSGSERPLDESGQVVLVADENDALGDGVLASTATTEPSQQESDALGENGGILASSEDVLAEEDDDDDDLLLSEEDTIAIELVEDDEVLANLPANDRNTVLEDVNVARSPSSVPGGKKPTGDQ